LILSEIGAVLPKWNSSAEFLSKLFITLVSNVSVTYASKIRTRVRSDLRSHRAKAHLEQ